MMLTPAVGVVVLWTCALMGCATTESTSSEPPGTLNRAALRLSRPRHIAAVPLRSPRFEGTTSGSQALGAFGLAGLAIAAFNAETEGRAAERKQIFDPAVMIRKDLAERLAKRFALQIQEAKQPGALNADLALSVQTSQWGFMPVSIGRYGVTYDGTLTLVDNRAKATLATGSCSSRPVDTPDAPTYDELLANEGAILKQKLGALEDFCIDDYRKRILGLYGD